MIVKDLKYKRYVLVVNMGNYLVDSGGTNKVVYSQEKILHKNYISLICIYPYKKVTIKGQVVNFWGIIIDGKTYGTFSTDGIKKYISYLSKKRFLLEQVIIHHLIGVDIDELTSLLNWLHIDTRLYIHDFYTLCPNNYLMLHNNKTNCLSSCVGDKDCLTCFSYKKSITRFNQIRKLIIESGLITDVVAPSSYALDKWKNAYKDYSGNTKVIHHQKLYGSYTGNNELLSQTDKIKIGYVGSSTNAKGWNCWLKAISENLERNEEFHSFGDSFENLPYLHVHRISFHDNANGMINALRNEKIHCVVLWSLIGETYSYTYFESLAANAFILTNKFSGNIALQVAQRGNGIICDSIDDLSNLLNNERALRDRINSFRSTSKNVPDILIENDEFIKDIPYKHNYYTYDGYIYNDKLCNVKFKIEYNLKCIKKSIKKNKIILKLLNYRNKIKINR